MIDAVYVLFYFGIPIVAASFYCLQFSVVTCVLRYPFFRIVIRNFAWQSRKTEKTLSGLRKLFLGKLRRSSVWIIDYASRRRDLPRLCTRCCCHILRKSERPVHKFASLKLTLAASLRLRRISG